MPALTRFPSLARLAFAAFAAFTLTAQAAVPEPVARALREASIPSDSVALWVATVGTDAPIAQHNSERLMNPASVMKLLTSYASLDILGSAYTWKTQAWLSGELKDGRLNGDLMIAASGDPDLTWDRLGQWLRDWRARGLRDIQGNILVDRSILPDPPPTTQFDDSPHRAYNALPDAFLVNFGALSVRLSPNTLNGGIATSLLTPASPLHILNHLRASAGPCVDWRDGLRGSLQAEGSGFLLTLDGKFPVSCGEKNYNLAVNDSNRWAASVLRAQWQELGGTWQGEIRSAPLPAGLPAPFSVWTSPPLSEVLRDMDKWSNNVMARMTFFALSNDARGALSKEKTLERLMPWMSQQGLDPTQWIFDNGSGLSRNERTSTTQLGILLRAAWRSPRMPELLAALPVIGADGTMRQRLPDTPVAGRGYVKTGSLDGVKALAGYILDEKGQWKCFAFIINHPHANSGETVVDALLNWLYLSR